ncbi:MAG TPA: hypothetical protein VFZ37_09720 [Jiangellaceae bacterium]
MTVQLHQLAAMLDRPGPYCTVLADVTRSTEDSEHQIELAMRSINERLTDAEAPPDLVDEVTGRFLEPLGVHGHVARFVVACEQGVLADEILTQWTAPEVATYGSLPDVTAWLAYKEDSNPVLVVRADKVGADLAWYGSWNNDRPDEQRRVDGETLHLNKVPDGGMAMTDLQSPTEEVWRRNARLVAGELGRMTGSHPPLIVLSGDPRASYEIREAMNPRLQSVTVEADHGSRAAGSSEANLRSEVGQFVRDALIHRRLAAVRDYQERLGQGRSVARGLGEVLDRCAMNQVETVLVDHPAAAETLTRPADHPGLALRASAAEDSYVRGDLAALAAAAATGAEATFVGPATLGDVAVAALLRGRSGAGSQVK